ncbi:MAG: phosphate transport system regulatory protein PhoU [Gemmatimonadetes bacterium]|nr:MAG: phosphate transport system regulatory protein PhoU [Gemmatimonadota bacterium]
MAKHFFTEIDQIKKEILALSALVEENVQLAIKALHERNDKLAKEVIKQDDIIDQKEVEIEEECLKVMALHQPVAVDLRFLVSVLKINNDLERVGDLAVNIANKASYFSRHPEITIPIDFGEIANKTKLMLKLSLDAFVNLDAELARQVCVMDEEVDRMKREAKSYIRKNINNDFDLGDRLYSVCRNLERISDMATNIAEDVVYMVEGRIIRHRAQDD